MQFNQLDPDVAGNVLMGHALVEHHVGGNPANTHLTTAQLNIGLESRGEYNAPLPFHYCHHEECCREFPATEFTVHSVEGLPEPKPIPEPDQIVAVGDALTAAMSGFTYTPEQATAKLLEVIDQLPQRKPGQSLTDAYAARVTAEVAERDLKAQRLDELHAWLTQQYLAAAKAEWGRRGGRHMVRALFFVETGLDPDEALKEFTDFWAELPLA